MRVATLLTLVGLAACGPSGVGPPATAPSRATMLTHAEDERLDAALAKKRAGDVFGAWKLIEDIPSTSAARLDDRYTEVMAAYADARTHQIGTEITGAKGGGPNTVETTTETAGAFAPQRIERVISEKRGLLRDQCYGTRKDPVSFQLYLEIDAEGRVIASSVSEIRGDPSVAECVLTKSRKWMFPRASEGGEHTTRFYFGR